MPVEIDQLETWGVGDRMLDDMLRGIHPDTAREIEWRRGALPPGQLGWRKATEVRETAMNLAVAALTHRQVEPKAYDVDIALPRRPPAHRHHHARLRRPAGRGRLLQARRQAPARVVGAAAGARRRPPRPQLDRAHDRPRAARHPARPAPPRSGRRRAPRAAVRPRASSTTRAAARRCSSRSRRRSPGPRPSARRRPPKPEAIKKWKSSRYPGEDADPAHVRVWGEHADLDTLTELPALAERLWFPLFDSERGPM